MAIVVGGRVTYTVKMKMEEWRIERKKERQLGPKFADDDDRIRMQGGRQSKYTYTHTHTLSQINKGSRQINLSLNRRSVATFVPLCL